MKSKKNDLSQIIAIFYNLNQTKERYFGQIYFEMKLKKNDLSQIEISLVFFLGGCGWLIYIFIYLTWTKPKKKTSTDTDQIFIKNN